MCGICGIVGKDQAVPIILEGLRRLEYRGYDSAGVATLDHETLERRRAAGKLQNLENLLDKKPIKGTVGIGHTRWATHGAPTAENAHPHMTSRVAIVHNGIIENFDILKKSLQAKGEVFKTQTDSEVIAILTDYHLREGMGPTQAALATFRQLKGSFAVAMIFRGYEDLMIAGSYRAPLAVGYGKGEMYVASDILAISPYTHTVTYLRDNECAVVTSKDVNFYDFQGKSIKRDKITVDVPSDAATKGHYNHFMEKELHEHPQVISKTLQKLIDPKTHQISLPHIPFSLAKVPRTVITGCGSAYYAGLVARYWLEKLARLPVDIDVASEMRYRNPPLDAQSLGILISQSGETADTLAALHELRCQDVHTLSVLNVEHSTMARESDCVLHTQAGAEIAVASTKAFTSQLTVLACLTLAVARERQTLSNAELKKLTQALLELPDKTREIFHQSKAIIDMAHTIAQAHDVLYLGRGSMLPVAMEGALKLKEISYIHAEAFAAGEMKHGPISLIDENVPVIASIPYTPLFEKTLSNLQEAKARGAPLMIFTDDKGAPHLKSLADKMVVIPYVHDFVAPIMQTIPVQILAYHVALIKGTDVDQPRNLAKSVTVE